jgi:hypothetical protein
MSVSGLVPYRPSSARLNYTAGGRATARLGQRMRECYGIASVLNMLTVAFIIGN